MLLNLPYFDEVLSTTIFCEKCNYKYSDILITGQKEPMELKLEIEKPEDLKTRIIRSSTATIELPELGIKIEPGIASDAFVSNIEGVLLRSNAVIQQALKFTDDIDKKNKAEELLNQIKNIQTGLEPLTIIIKDPMGNSAIVNEKTLSRKLTQTEIDKLETGMMVFDVDHTIETSIDGEKKKKKEVKDKK
jgi:zinc finger protein